MLNIVIQKSHNTRNKYTAIINGTKTISFGAAGYQDFTTHKDTQRRQNYIRRHSNEDWTRSNVESAAWLSRYILWEKPSLQEAIKHASTMYKDVKFSLKY